MRFYSYLFHGLLALFLLAIAALSLFSGTTLRLGMLPWTGKELTYWLFFSALFGLVSLLLAVWGKMRPLFLLWSVVVMAMLIRGYFLSPYHFSGSGEWHTALYLTAGSILALAGAWFQLRRAPVKRGF